MHIPKPLIATLLIVNPFALKVLIIDNVTPPLPIGPVHEMMIYVYSFLKVDTKYLQLSVN